MRWASVAGVTRNALANSSEFSWTEGASTLAVAGKRKCQVRLPGPSARSVCPLNSAYGQSQFERHVESAPLQLQLRTEW